MMLLLFFLVDENCATIAARFEFGATDFHSTKADNRCTSAEIEMRPHPELRQRVAIARDETGSGSRRNVHHVCRRTYCCEIIETFAGSCREWWACARLSGVE